MGGRGHCGKAGERERTVKKGQLAIIIECHTIPEFVGKTAEGLVTNGLDYGSKYPIHVQADGCDKIIGFREDELKIIGRDND